MDLYTRTKNKMIDRHSIEDVDKNNMTFSQNRRMKSEDLYSRMVNTKRDWKEKDTVLNNHKINTQTQWISRELDFSKAYQNKVENMLNKNNYIDDRTNNVKLNLAMRDVQLAEEHQRRRDDFKKQRDNTLNMRDELNKSWKNDDTAFRNTVKQKELKVFTNNNDNFNFHNEY